MQSVVKLLSKLLPEKFPKFLASITLAALVCMVAVFVQSCGDRTNEWTVLNNLQYVPSGTNRNQSLDLYLPPQDPSKRPAKLIVYIHGGGWAGGDKSDLTLEMSHYPRWAFASINYRLSSEAIFPAQIYDCKAAIRWLRAHAKQYKYDPDHIAVWGTSAGGNLAALLGTTGGDKQYEGNEGDTSVSSKVQAVCDWCGPTDLVAMGREAGPDNLLKLHDKDGVVAKYLGGLPEERRALADMANPCLQAQPGDPPFLLMHGDADTLVPVQQSDDLYKALQEVGVQSQLITIPGGTHNFYSPQALAVVHRFFEQAMSEKSADRKGVSEKQNLLYRHLLN